MPPKRKAESSSGKSKRRRPAPLKFSDLARPETLNIANAPLAYTLAVDRYRTAYMEAEVYERTPAGPGNMERMMRQRRAFQNARSQYEAILKYESDLIIPTHHPGGQPPPGGGGQGGGGGGAAGGATLIPNYI